MTLPTAVGAINQSCAFSKVSYERGKDKSEEKCYAGGVKKSEHLPASSGLPIHGTPLV
jgi:hypothetical protein